MTESLRPVRKNNCNNIHFSVMNSGKIISSLQQVQLIKLHMYLLSGSNGKQLPAAVDYCALGGAFSGFS